MNKIIDQSILLFFFFSFKCSNKFKSIRIFFIWRTEVRFMTKWWQLHSTCMVSSRIFLKHFFFTFRCFCSLFFSSKSFRLAIILLNFLHYFSWFQIHCMAIIGLFSHIHTTHQIVNMYRVCMTRGLYKSVLEHLYFLFPRKRRTSDLDLEIHLHIFLLFPPFYLMLAFVRLYAYISLHLASSEGGDCTKASSLPFFSFLLF